MRQCEMLDAASRYTAGCQAPPGGRPPTVDLGRRLVITLDYVDWAELERAVEQVFAADGYTTARNTRIVGRSGGTHEIDVLAEKQDAVTSVRVAVECKAWDRPINKDVVAKAAWVRDDAGIHKTIVVTS